MGMEELKKHTPLRARDSNERGGRGVLTPKRTPENSNVDNNKHQIESKPSKIETPAMATRSMPEKSTPISLSRCSSTSSGFAFISHSPTTYPALEPSIDNAQLARRKRRRTSALELSILENEFSKNSKPTKEQRNDICKRVGMTEKAVQIWFQNKRQSHRKQQQRGAHISMKSNSFPQQKSDSDNSFHIYNDEDDNNSNKNSNFKRLKLSVSDDGKAEIVPLKKRTLATALSPVKDSALNSRLSPTSPTKSPTKQRRSIADREQECISNLLSLKSGAWN